MSHRIIAVVIDTVANDILGTPMVSRADAPLVRTLVDVIKNGDGQVGRFPHDHIMKEIATIDDETLTVTPSNRLIISGTQIVAMLEGNKAKEATN